jgi:hypothetical protein
VLFCFIIHYYMGECGGFNVYMIDVHIDALW